MRRWSNMHNFDGIGILPKPIQMSQFNEPVLSPTKAWTASISVAIRHDEFRGTPDGDAALQAVGFIALTVFGADVVTEGMCGSHMGIHIWWDRPAAVRYREALLAYLCEVEDVSHCFPVVVRGGAGGTQPCPFPPCNEFSLSLSHTSPFFGCLYLAARDQQ